MGNKQTSQQAGHGNDFRGRNRRNQGHEGKDVHEKIEGLASDKKPKAGDPPVAKLTPDDEEQDNTKKLNLSSESTEVPPIESSDEVSQGGATQPAASPADMSHPEKETEPCLEEHYLLVAKEGEASKSTADTESEILGSSIAGDGLDNKGSEASSLEIPSNNIEEVPQPQEKSMLLSENKEKMDTSENKNESSTDEVDSSQSGLVMAGSDSGDGKKDGENRMPTETTPVVETVPTELPATECNNEEEEIEEKKVIEAAEKQEVEPGKTSPSAGNEAEKSGPVEIKKSPSFDFDVSMETRPGEPVQTPLLQHNKNHTRSLSMFDGSSKGAENLRQNEAVTAEEKTIEVAISDSDRTRATLQNVMKEGEGKVNVAVEPQKQDSEKKADEESCTGTTKEVSLKEEIGEPKPKPSPLRKFLCCAA